ncbi:protein FAM124B isoform X2 [Lagopus leucura]|uniref:protein FAM124B isoform X2 n=1 Tax=Lagopus leucura TaxID=30410 RepID=UPI001C686DD8|nr:protein FAM124B isoform X2 [Lagopus leucura]
MGDRAEPLMTVHLLANSGYSAFLQQALDRLMEWICPDVRLFFVSERVAPLKYYERYQRRNCSFPGISVFLFLQEDLGEERILQVQDLLQHPPWHYQRVPTWPRSHPHTPAPQDFYGLDDQMPVWGIRRVGCSPEILRVTLYCSFDNYDDAVGLYEMILRKEATLRKSNFCVFVLYATKTIAVQLCLKQLPIGMAAEPKESSLLQFKVQEMGQLVPLLPNPCIPISRTRWQTQDYEGNKILLQVKKDAAATCDSVPGEQHGAAGPWGPPAFLPLHHPIQHWKALLWVRSTNSFSMSPCWLCQWCLPAPAVKKPRTGLGGDWAGCFGAGLYLNFLPVHLICCSCSNPGQSKLCIVSQWLVWGSFGRNCTSVTPKALGG